MGKKTKTIKEREKIYKISIGVLLVAFLIAAVLAVDNVTGKITGGRYLPWQKYHWFAFSAQDLNDGYGNTVDIHGGGVVIEGLTGRKINGGGVMVTTIDGVREVFGWEPTAADIASGEASLILKTRVKKSAEAQPEYLEVSLLKGATPRSGTIEVIFRGKTFVGSGMVNIR